MESSPLTIKADIETISKIPVIPAILDVVCRTTGMGFAAVARVTEKKWVACAVKDEINFGLTPGGELQLETTICHEIRSHGLAVVIDDVKRDEQYQNHHTPAFYGFQSYISVPILKKDGSFFGTLCAIDPAPHLLNDPKITEMFRLFADLISFHLNSAEELTKAQEKLVEEQKTAELREHFIAILGHDLRNPVNAVSNVAELLLRMPLDERTARLAQILRHSSYRMKGLIENVLDFARGRMGDGIKLELKNCDNLLATLGQVVEELALVFPARVIETNFNLTKPIICDESRIAQLFSNLLSNALTHGNHNDPVRVNLSGLEQGISLSVCNSGNAISPLQMERLFEPFSRGEVKPDQQGLGLGLYIASQIALAHKGNLTVESDQHQTCFTLMLPESNINSNLT